MRYRATRADGQAEDRNTPPVQMRGVNRFSSSAPTLGAARVVGPNLRMFRGGC
jgi:hypothetical protein